jgi:hypothetical protein
MGEHEFSKNSQQSLSSRDAARAYGVTHDYVARLARQGQIKGELTNRSWIVDRDSLASHFAAKGKMPIGGLQKLYVKELPIKVLPSVGVEPGPMFAKTYSGFRPTRMVLASLVAFLLLGSFVTLAAPQAIKTFQAADTLAAAAGYVDSPFFGYSFLSKIFSLFAPHTSPVAVTPPSSQPVATTTPIQTTNNYVTNNYTTNNNTYHTTNNNVPASLIAEGVTQTELDSKLNSFRSDLNLAINGFSNQTTQNYASGGTTNNLALAQKIDKLSGVQILSSTILGSTIEGYLPTSGGTITGDLTVTGACTGCGGGGGSDTNWAYFNGSGIHPATTTNQVLIGASATSSLAMLEVVGGALIDHATTTSFYTTTSSSTNSFSTFSTIGTATIGIASTSQLYGANLSTCQGGNVLTWNNGLFGCAADQTSTGGLNPFAWANNFNVIAAATTSPIWAQNGLFASSTSHFVNADFTNATTTNFGISSIASGNLLKTTTAGSIIAAVSGTDYATPAQIAAAFPFTPSTFGTTAANSTSTLIKFTAGIASLASSTIGDGTQIGGLTISGGATTTGNAYFAGNVGIGTTSPTHKLEVNGSAQIGAAYSDLVTIPGDLNVATQGGNGFGDLTVGLGNRIDFFYKYKPILEL